MRLFVSNQTEDELYLCNLGDDSCKACACVLPFSTDKMYSLRKNSNWKISQFPMHGPREAPTEAVTVMVPHGLWRAWKPLQGLDASPWIAYYTKSDRRSCSLVVIPRRDSSSFLKGIPDSVPLSCLMLPGTHETMAFYGWPISQCQSQNRSLDIQLNAGIRVIDVRLSIIGTRLIAYHGIVSQRTPFSDILRQLHTFLSASSTCSETVVVSIKQEDNDTRRFSELVREEILASPGGLDLWYLEHRIPKLGEVRGKAVMFSRFGGQGQGWRNGAIGIHPPIWPDSERLGFTWKCKETLVRTQDWYAIPSFLWIPEKVALSTEILVPPEDSPSSVLSITFLSASSPLALPPLIARGLGWPKIRLGFEGVNARVGKWLLDRLTGPPDKDDTAGPRVRGWALMDFFQDPAGLVPLFIECNFRGRKAGEEGWF
ncbi:hypothetical protein ID866_4208 [Astraeus odoratus]|nr:hypothetical protein ID866_4208 [Astraeus odoratus]